RDPASPRATSGPVIDREPASPRATSGPIIDRDPASPLAISGPVIDREPPSLRGTFRPAIDTSRLLVRSGAVEVARQPVNLNPPIICEAAKHDHADDRAI